MNHNPAQFSHIPFAFPASIPNPNLYHSQPQNAPPEINTPPPLPPVLSTAISSLDNVICDSSRILESLSTILPVPSQDDSDDSDCLVSCPVNPHHRLPPRSLFSHSLRCPRPLHHLLPPLHYPKTLNSTTDQSQSGESFIGTHHGSEATDLCLSLEHYYAEFGCNFFYHDCPGVVNSSALDGFDKTFTLPSVLSAECANFAGEVRETLDCDKVCSRFLPSESWAVKNEVQGWNEYPSNYSSCVLRAILGLGVLRECDLAIWVIANSPKYGIVIDVPMGDHIVLLITLCLKAILREALGKVNHRDLDSRHFECPTLVEALVWMASQLSKLYDESNGKFFAINILKHCLLEFVLGSFVFPLEKKETEFHGLEEGSLNLDVEGTCVRDEDVTEPVSTEMKGIIIKKAVYVSQVAAAIAALHELFLVEEKIKGERASETLSRHQRALEHDHVSRKADEERKTRSQYRPIIDHDGLPRQKSSNQETNKTKTKEELLAEERDYKRRRMSYHGKKVKRTTLQVTRDIIEEYMEEIKQAGGIGCFEREEQGSIPFKPPTATDFTTDDDNPTKNNSESDGGSPSRSRKQSCSHYTIHSSTSRHAPAKDQEKPRHSLHSEYLEETRSLSNSRETEYYSKSPERSRSRGWSYGQSEQDHRHRTNTKHHERYRSSKYHDSRSKCHDNRSSLVSNSQQESKVKRYEKTYESHSSNSLERDAFDDRYDPLESHDKYEEDQSSLKKYAREGRYSVNEQSSEYK